MWKVWLDSVLWFQLETWIYLFIFNKLHSSLLHFLAVSVLALAFSSLAYCSNCRSTTYSFNSFIVFFSIPVLSSTLFSFVLIFMGSQIAARDSEKYFGAQMVFPGGAGSSRPPENKTNSRVCGVWSLLGKRWDGKWISQFLSHHKEPRY